MYNVWLESKIASWSWSHISIPLIFNGLSFKGETPTSNTGPTSAALGSYYKYAEATGHHPGDEAILQSNVPFACKSFSCVYEQNKNSTG